MASGICTPLLTHDSVDRQFIAEPPVSEGQINSSVMRDGIPYYELGPIYQPRHNAIVTPGRFSLRYPQEPQSLASPSEVLIPDHILYPREYLPTYVYYSKSNLSYILISNLAMFAEKNPIEPQRTPTQLHKCKQPQSIFDPDTEFRHTLRRGPRSHEPSNEPITQGQVCSLQGAIALAHAPATIQGIHLVPVIRLPDRLRHIFSFGLFNAIQSKAFDAVYGSNDNVIVSAPTGSGKTTIMELAICRLVSLAAQGTYKVIYQAPTKALCAEKKRFLFFTLN